jgi:hypothetical protein
MAFAERELANCRSVQGRSWLVLGLAAHGKVIAEDLPQSLKCRTVPDLALAVLAARAQNGDHSFVGGADAA